MKLTKANRITEYLNHASMADKSGRTVLAEKYRNIALSLMESEALELEPIRWIDGDIVVELDISELLEPTDDYNAEDLIDKITTSDKNI